MGLLGRLFGRTEKVREPIAWSWPRIGILPLKVETGEFSVGLVGEPGFQREIKAARKLFRSDYVPVYLHREPNKPDDPNAVAVMSGLQEVLGYLNSNQAHWYARVLDEVAAAGLRATCVAKIARGSKGKSLVVSIDLPKAGDISVKLKMRRGEL